ncbi:MAG: nucleotidyltransferase family protein [Pseudomonadota bacterium]
MRLAAVVLAAGQSRRFGANKQLLEVAGEALVRRAVRTVASVEPRILAVVLGHDAERVASAAQAPFLIVNENYADGLGTSVACAAEYFADDAGALLIALADQPLVPAAHYMAIRSAWNGRADAVVATRYGSSSDSQLGAPALFGAEYFPELRALSGDRGAQELFSRHRRRVVEVACGAAAFDIDTPEDLEAAGLDPLADD